MNTKSSIFSNRSPGLVSEGAVYLKGAQFKGVVYFFDTSAVWASIREVASIQAGFYLRKCSITKVVEHPLGAVPSYTKSPKMGVII